MYFHTHARQEATDVQYLGIPSLAILFNIMLTSSLNHSKVKRAWPIVALLVNYCNSCYSILTNDFLKSLGSIPGKTSCSNGSTWWRPAG